MVIGVEYEKNLPHLHKHLFIKFSRDFDNVSRDAGRFQIVVPVCYFADFHGKTGTGILITQCIPYGENGVSHQFEKALDYNIPDALSHYRTMIRTLARLAASSKHGAMQNRVDQLFPFEPNKLDVSTPKNEGVEQLRRKIDGCTQFINNYPQLFPENLIQHHFLVRFRTQATLFQAQQCKVNAILKSNSGMIALCHWNAHIDNAWFWRSEDGELECGLLDWGNVGQMNLAMSIWGCLSAAELDLWDHDLDDLITEFTREYHDVCGKHLDQELLRKHLVIYMASMGLNWLLDGPPRTLRKIEDLETIESRFDQRIESNETARAQLQIMIVFLNLWEKSDMESIIEDMEQFQMQQSN